MDKDDVLIAYSNIELIDLIWSHKAEFNLFIR